MTLSMQLEAKYCVWKVIASTALSVMAGKGFISDIVFASPFAKGTIVNKEPTYYLMNT